MDVSAGRLATRPVFVPAGRALRERDEGEALAQDALAAARLSRREGVAVAPEDVVYTVLAALDAAGGGSPYRLAGAAAGLVAGGLRP